MVKNYIKSMDILYQYEKKYADELERNPIKILRQIKVSKEEVAQIAKNIKILFRYNKKSLKNSFPITVSLFIVWCTVYEYKDGDMWSNICKKLRIPSIWNNKGYLGDIFLNVLDRYELLQVQEGEGKRYLSPILMHGYISDHYAFNLFDSLNRIYSLVLEEDISEEAIDDIWDDVFNKDMELKKIRHTIRELVEIRKDLEDELEFYRDLDEEVKELNRDDIEKLEAEVFKLESDIKSNRKNIKINENKLNIHSHVNNKLERISSRFPKVSSKLASKYCEEVKDITKLISHIGEIIKDRDRQIINRNDMLLKETKGMENKLAVKKETLISYKTKIASLGQGVLEDGWGEVERYHQLKEKLNHLVLEIRRNERYERIAETELNTSLYQSLTASLNNLKVSDPEHFKEFISSTLQMMGAYFTGQKVDITHPLYEIFLEWTNRELNRDAEKPDYIPTYAQKPRTREEQIERRRLVLQTMKKPYIKLDTNNLLLKVIIPQQRFEFKQNITKRPTYKLVDQDYNSFGVEIDYAYHNQNLYIKEKEILLDATSYQYLHFQWYNLNESHDISLDEVMLFDESGTLLSGNKVKNGYYYIVCSNYHIAHEELIIDEYHLSLDGYKIYEVYLNESKAVLYKDDGDKQYEIISTDYDYCYLINNNPIEGLYVDDLPTVTGYLPELFINYIAMDPNLIQLRIFLNDHLTYHKELSNLIGSNKYAGENTTTKINIYKLLRLKTPIPSKFKIELSYKDKELLSEEFYYLPHIQFKYTNEGLRVAIKRGMRFSATNYKQKGMEYIVPLKDKKGESFSIYYNMHGWVKVWVEVPSVDFKIVYKNGEVFSEDNILYGSKRELLKDLFIQWESKSKRIKSILLSDNNRYLETRIYLKEGKARTSLYQYYDIFRGKDGGKLYYRIEDEYINFPEELILELFDKWEVNNIRVYQKEEVDEYIVGIDYDENFSLKETKYLEVLNEGKPVIYKTIKDQLYVYIKKTS